MLQKLVGNLYVVYNILRTSEVSSPVLGQYIFASLIAFVIVYAFIFGGGIYYIITLIKKGPSTTTIVLGNPTSKDNINHA